MMRLSEQEKFAKAMLSKHTRSVFVLGMPSSNFSNIPLISIGMFLQAIVLNDRGIVTRAAADTDDSAVATDEEDGAAAEPVENLMTDEEDEAAAGPPSVKREVVSANPPCPAARSSPSRKSKRRSPSQHDLGPIKEEMLGKRRKRPVVSPSKEDTIDSPGIMGEGTNLSPGVEKLVSESPIKDSSPLAAECAEQEKKKTCHKKQRRKGQPRTTHVKVTRQRDTSNGRRFFRKGRVKIAPNVTIEWTRFSPIASVQDRLDLEAQLSDNDAFDDFAPPKKKVKQRTIKSFCK